MLYYELLYLSVVWFILQVNDELVYTTLISQDSLRKLTKEDAMKHLKENKNFEELIHQKPVLSSDIRVIENYGADVSIITKT